jgi:aarF domain-containing kinase
LFTPTFSNPKILTGNNQAFGSPVNRVKITGFWASRSQIRNTNLSLVERVKEWWHDLVFRTVMFSLDVAFWKAKFDLWFRGLQVKLHLRSPGTKGPLGFEEELEKTMRGLAKDSLGIDVAQNVFAG